MKKLILIFLSFTCLISRGQEIKHRVYFSNKGQQITKLNTPSLFLSPKAIGRRAKQGIPINHSDLPVAQEYLAAIKEQGAKVHFASRWFNYALVSQADVATLENLPFVQKIEPAKKHKVQWANTQKVAQNFNYGLADNQITMLNGQALHNLDYTGRGVTIAVIDGGFAGTPGISAFDSLRADGRLLGTYNFVDTSTNVYQGGTHGSLVLSCIAGILPDEFVGTAPHASYWLLKSEDEQSETPVEMDNWLAAAEYADSVGAQVINSSLGYSKFDDSNDDFTYQDMDGNTTIVTKAADMAAQKGIIVVVSAGNSGSNQWQYITAPADADSVLTVGAVEANGLYANFSSQGPSFDQRIKPDVVAQGSPAAAVGTDGEVRGAFGTSFSSPIMAGLMACLVQAAPNKTNMQLINQVRRSSSQYFTPDGFLGYGIPNFNTAFALGTQTFTTNGNAQLKVYPLPFNNQLFLQMLNISGRVEAQVSISNMAGQSVYATSLGFSADGPLALELNLPKGFYYLNVKTASQTFTQKIMR